MLKEGADWLSAPVSFALPIHCLEPCCQSNGGCRSVTSRCRSHERKQPVQGCSSRRQAINSPNDASLSIQSEMTLQALKRMVGTSHQMNPEAVGQPARDQRAQPLRAQSPRHPGRVSKGSIRTRHCCRTSSRLSWVLHAKLGADTKLQHDQ